MGPPGGGPTQAVRKRYAASPRRSRALAGPGSPTPSSSRMSGLVYLPPAEHAQVAQRTGGASTMDVQVVRQMVRQFWEKTAHTGGEPHCFAPWYLHQTFQLPETQAMQQASDGSYDFGIDAFHLDQGNDGKPVSLVLVQAKYSESLQHIIKGFRDLEKALPEVSRSLEAIGTEEPVQNKVLVNLRAALNRLDPETRARQIGRASCRERG